MDLESSRTDKGIPKSPVQEWSKWLDFNIETISSVVPEESGLFKVHASMKILYIGAAQNLKATLLESVSDPCIRRGQRFSYLIDHGPLEKLKAELVNDYKLRHNGTVPACMESNMQ